MKKKFISIIIVIIILVSLAGCADKINSEGSKSYETNTGLVAIPDAKNLYYDSQTKIVYFVFSEHYGYSGYGYMSAYCAPNGLPYLYDPFAQELVEISR